MVVLVDSQRDQIKRQRAARKIGVEVTIALDIVHVLDYLWRAAYALNAARTEKHDRADRRAADVPPEHGRIRILNALFSRKGKYC